MVAFVGAIFEVLAMPNGFAQEGEAGGGRPIAEQDMRCQAVTDYAVRPAAAPDSEIGPLSKSMSGRRVAPGTLHCGSEGQTIELSFGSGWKLAFALAALYHQHRSRRSIQNC
jgi:hypothetical protein